MSFIRRWLGGAAEGGPDREPEPTPEEIEADERAHELELLRAEQARLDELRQRQLRYADRAWTPPAQGGERRADDADRDREAAGDDAGEGPGEDG